jgi:hypothetical protein
MVTIVKKILFETEKRPGRKSKEQSKENENKFNLEVKLYDKFLNERTNDSIFYLATVQTFPFNNMFIWLSNLFHNVELEITPKGISLVNWWGKFKKNNNKKYDVLHSLLAFQPNRLFILDGYRVEKYECNVDQITLHLDAAELSVISSYITADSVVRLFINKMDFNEATTEAASVEFHITDQLDNSLSYISLTFTCKKYVEVEDDANTILDAST